MHRGVPNGGAPSGVHTVQNFGPETTAIVYGLQNRAVQVCVGRNCFLPDLYTYKWYR